jgi:ABC-type branched-subunit amino acid transport system ATPase component
MAEIEFVLARIIPGDWVLELGCGTGRVLEQLTRGNAKIVNLCYEAIDQLKRGGLTIILVEQSTERALAVADQVCVLESGLTVWKGPAAEARKNSAMIDALLGLGEA